MYNYFVSFAVLMTNVLLFISLVALLKNILLLFFVFLLRLSNLLGLSIKYDAIPGLCLSLRWMTWWRRRATRPLRSSLSKTNPSFIKSFIYPASWSSVAAFQTGQNLALFLWKSHAVRFFLSVHTSNFTFSNFYLLT